MPLYSRWALRSIPELASFPTSERVLLWNRAARTAGLEYWFRVGLFMGVIGGFGGGVGSEMDHPLVGAVLGGVVSGVVVTLLMGRPIRRRLHDEILKVGLPGGVPAGPNNQAVIPARIALRAPVTDTISARCRCRPLVVDEGEASRFRAMALIVCLAASGASLPRQDRQAPLSPQEWVAFSADVRINSPNRAEAWGRYVQDEHGCVRQEMVHHDGSALITMTNFQTERMYRLYHGAWTGQPMRMSTMPRRPYQRSVSRKTD